MPNIRLSVTKKRRSHLEPFEAAIAECNEGIKIAPRNELAHLYLTSAYSLSGAEKQARTEAEVRKDSKRIQRSRKSLTMPYAK